MINKIVITGATSFIGIHLISKLLLQGQHVYAVIRPDSPHRNRLPVSENLTVIELDLSQIRKISSVVSQADVFYHLAWEGTRAPYRDDPKLQRDNYQYAVQAMEAAEEMGIKLFVGTGSQAEYGKMEGDIDETYPGIPLTAYGIEKLHAAQELAQMAEQAGIRFCWMRIFSAYGELDYEGTLIMTCIRKMLLGEKVELTACTQNWDYTYIGDIVDAMFGFVNVETAHGIYNIASGKSRPLRLFVEEIKKQLNSDSEVVYGAVPYGKEGPVSMKPVSDKLQKDLGWTAATSFSEGIEAVRQYISKNN